MTRALPALAILVVLALAPAAQAQEDVVDRAITALRSDPVYVDQSAERKISEADADRLRQAIRAKGAAPLYIAMLPGGAVGGTGGADGVVRRLREEVGRPGTYAVVAGDRFRALSDDPKVDTGIAPRQATQRVRGARRRRRPRGRDAARLHRPHGRGPRRAGTPTRRRPPGSRRRCSCCSPGRRRAGAQAAPPAARAPGGDGRAEGERPRRPGRARRRHPRARPRRRARRHRPGAEGRLRAGRGLLRPGEHAGGRWPRPRATWPPSRPRSRRAASRWRRPRRAPRVGRCPSGGRRASSTRATARRPATSSGRRRAARARPVPACEADALRVEEGEEPESRSVVVDGERRPYWDAGPAYAPMAGGYFGDGLLPGLVIGTALSGGFSTGGAARAAGAGRGRLRRRQFRRGWRRLRSATSAAAAGGGGTPAAATSAGRRRCGFGGRRRLRRRRRRVARPPADGAGQRPASSEGRPTAPVTAPADRI